MVEVVKEEEVRMIIIGIRWILGTLAVTAAVLTYPILATVAAVVVITMFGLGIWAYGVEIDEES